MNYNSIGSIVAVLGNSGAGKDTISSIILKQDKKAIVHKWSAPMKRMLEYVYDLPTGSLENRQIRSQEVPDMPGVSYTEIMVRSFTHFRAIDDRMMVRKVLKAIWSDVETGKTAVLNDLRTPLEAEEISSLGKLYPLHTILVERYGCKGLDSDKYLIPNFKKLSTTAQTVHKIQNNGDIDALHHVTNTILEHIKRTKTNAAF